MTEILRTGLVRNISVRQIGAPIRCDVLFISDGRCKHASLSL